ncbi:MAG TPA: 2-C-methyl-D-erythritol 4-phosphate cytidylyltransferase [Egibacteraceae bacterium]|nr:2-C-methyl-D-erythritol 4-phosphate cytidylyltransferase [Egibacteraceae bacterium]
MSPATCIIAAAGAGDRLGASGPKAFAPLAGEPLLVHCVRAVAACDAIDDIVVVVGRDQLAAADEAIVRAGLDSHRITVCPGGETRSQSVFRGLDACPPQARIVAVHDAARPLVTPGLIERAVAALADGWEAVAPGLPVVDTLKLVHGGEGAVTRTVDRAGIWAVQTPQVFAQMTLQRAHEAQDFPDVTDDLELVQRLGCKVRLVPGERRNFKVTYPEDLALAEALLIAERKAGERG